MMLNLDRPLAFIDLETTGKDVSNDRIVQIAVLKVFPDGSEEMRSKKINPTIPISPEASKVHGIVDADVINAPIFSQIATSVATYLEDSDLAGYNSNKFDIPLLMAEFERADVEFKLEGRRCIDVQEIFFKMQPRTLQAAYQFYCNQRLENAHDAEADIRATYEVLKAQIQRYEETGFIEADGSQSFPIKNNVQVLSEFTPFNFLDPEKKVVYDEQQRIIFNFGKHKGKVLVEVFKDDPGYYDWLMSTDFPVSSKRVFEREFKALS
ncbi:MULTISPECIES: 3'-5' exonuclease [Leptolyngbya]|uniref:3'-5' exonuclease n=1 Tax=Leptolyngbya TaxID=47251 RepID=UPI001686CBD4|nr:3'-5' exonuclease [Leptolyngbya sp. FACHB-1624]MBD1859976.1 3'-5' exonuclease [Leptolyngbya sp. FACHB-1624]